MIYKGEFRNTEDELISVIIGSEGDTEELLLAANPVIITSSSDGLFAPIKADACTIKVLTTSIYKEIYSSTAQGTSVQVKNETTGEVLFYGYVTPNIYSQEYESLDALEIEATSALSSLQYYRYRHTQTIVNWYNVIKRCFQKAGYYKSFYFPDNFNYEKAEELQMPFLKALYQFEDNFFDDDEENTGWTYKDILEEFCRYMGLSLVVYKAQLYFIDYEYKGSKYFLYNLEDDTVEEVDLSDVYTITADSYKESGTTISYDETYNKISIKDNLYDVQEVIPEVMEDLENMDSDPNKYYEEQQVIDGETYTIVSSFFKSKKWHLRNYWDDPIITDETIANDTASFWQKVDYYKSDEEPSSLNWATYFTMYNNSIIGNLFNDTTFMLELIENPEFICNGGYFIVDMQFKLSKHKLAADCLKTSDQTYSNSSYSSGFTDTLFPCRLYIGDYWFDGAQWQHKSEYLRKKNKGYYQTNKVWDISEDPLPTWYKYRDADGDWKFTNNKAEWDAATTEKKSGSYKNFHHVYCLSEGSSTSFKDRIYIDEEYYHECKLQDRFYLAKRNEEGDKIFDEMKQLTNTVSWKMNIEDSSDGVAIKLPDFILFGKLIFELYAPSQLGTYPNLFTYGVQQKCEAIHIKKLTFSYKASDKLVDLFDSTKKQDDVIYTNVINTDYVNEWDDLEIKINSQVDNRITSKSSMLIKTADQIEFLTKVYNKTQNEYRIQENNLIEKYYNHYSSPKAILEINIENKLKPYSIIKETNLGKDFNLDSYEYDVYSDTLNAKLIEYGN